jgi:hypothetical protein
MAVVCTAVGANQLTANLAGHIMRVCDQLKHVGQHMDVYHAGNLSLNYCILLTSRRNEQRVHTPSAAIGKNQISVQNS